MIEQSFTSKNLISFLSPIDFYKYNLDKNNFESKVEIASKKIQSNKFEIKNLKKAKIHDTVIFSVKTLENHLALKKLNSNLIKMYKVRQSDRETIIHQIKTLLQDEIPKWVLKYDIKNFYESINRDKLIENINNNYIISHKSKNILNSVFEFDEIKAQNGVPRGLCISGTLSELAMREFDRKIRKLEGIYFYARYVDDIIIFSYIEPTKIDEIVKSLLPYPLLFNSLKSQNFHVTCQNPFSCKKKCKCPFEYKNKNEFDYLGYKFIFPNVPIAKTEQYVQVSIGTSKIKKMKSRIIYSLLDHIKSPNFYLLNKRIQFLTGNYKLKKIDNYSSNLHSGIFYNYKSIDGDLKILDDLDLFLRKSINSNKNGFGQKLKKALCDKDKNTLLRYSFRKGFQLRLTHTFTSDDIHAIKRCWRI